MFLNNKTCFQPLFKTKHLQAACGYVFIPGFLPCLAIFLEASLNRVMFAPRICCPCDNILDCIENRSAMLPDAS